ncbi:Aste57867_2883 [Aphanomyces stellatus]|uniref:Aste57867_2883 protein n=1 Tax=Aphanomyces stellatus TaxID=120398 RepID=A0A485KE74_9STRA|nr:hypothetical protein As57867_002875 [Aphanomyces stellatus]VFT80067.1 Aste57867_2883 [Aphanomyces stellatus]
MLEIGPPMMQRLEKVALQALSAHLAHGLQPGGNACDAYSRDVADSEFVHRRGVAQEPKHNLAILSQRVTEFHVAIKEDFIGSFKILQIAKKSRMLASMPKLDKIARILLPSS